MEASHVRIEIFEQSGANCNMVVYASIAARLNGSLIAGYIDRDASQSKICEFYLPILGIEKLAEMVDMEGK
jgi:hypothetical protein